MSNIRISDKKVFVQSAVNVFETVFKEKPQYGAYAPGRVNLIGEHTDYNDGYVLPMALPLGTVVLGVKTNSGKCHIVTTCMHADDPTEIELNIPTSASPLTPGKPKWANYIKGVMANFPGPIRSFNALIFTTIPVGGGLSSSAALEVSFYTFLETLLDEENTISLKDKALACQKAEHEFAGMPCGIMDQFISFMGKTNNALLIDCRSMELTPVPLNDPNIVVLVTNSHVRHELTGSEYSTRRSNCEQAAKILGVASLRDATLENLQSNENKLTEEMFRYARHVITEIARTKRAADALKKGDYKQVGRYMTESHISLRDDYKVSCDELNQLVDAALEIDGVYGSRMTGGGFGGCTVTLVLSSAVDRVVEHMKAKFHGNPTFYVCTPSDGAHQLQLGAY